MITPRQGHSDEVTRLDISLLDSLIRGRKVHLAFTIMCHMLSIPAVSNRSLPYGSIISKILWYFHVLLTKHVYVETQKLGREIISGIGFHWRQSKWIKVKFSKNEDTLVALEDDRMLNDIYSDDELPDFWLGARPCAHRQAAAAPSQDKETAEPVVPTAAPLIF